MWYIFMPCNPFGDHHLQKQPPEVFYKKVSEKFRNIHRKHLCWSATLLKRDANKACNLLERDSNAGVEEHLRTAASTPQKSNKM